MLLWDITMPAVMYDDVMGYLFFTNFLPPVQFKIAIIFEIKSPSVLAHVLHGRELTVNDDEFFCSHDVGQLEKSMFGARLLLTSL